MLDRSVYRCQYSAIMKPQPKLSKKYAGRLGGLKGGKSRAEKLSPERRREIAIIAAEKRWSKEEKQIKDS